VASTNKQDDVVNVIVTHPTHFHELYDAELERMIDETVDDASSSDNTVSVAVYVPPGKPMCLHQGWF